MNILIEQGHVICPLQNIDKITDIYIQNGKILGFAPPKKTFTPHKIINAKHHWVFPGLVDLYCDIKDVNGDVIEKEAKEACEAGYTTVFCSPRGKLATDKPARVKRLSQTDQWLDVIPIGALTESLEGHQISDLTALRNAGCAVFSQDLHPSDLNTIRNCYLYAASFGLKVMIFPLEHSLAKGFIHEGLVSAITGIKGIPYSAETIAVSSHLQLIEETGVSAHFTHITSAKSIELIQGAQQKKLPVTADCTMAHLHLSEMDVIHLDPSTHLRPPLRSTADLMSLRRAVNEGVLTAISSSHQPVPNLAKLAPFEQTTPGIGNFKLILSLGLHLVNQKHLALNTLIKCLSQGPLQAYGLKPLKIAPGEKADLCIVDPARYWVVGEKMQTHPLHHMPFKGWELPGMITTTLKNGKIAYEEATQPQIEDRSELSTL